MRSVVLGAAALAAVALAPPARADGPKRVTLRACACFSPERPTEAGRRLAPRLDRVRPALLACHERALLDAPDLAAELAAELAVGPGGEVASVALGARSPVPDEALACFKRVLAGVSFDPPSGGAASVAVALVLGDPRPPGRPAALPFRAEPATAWRAVVPPIHLAAPRPPPEARAVRAVVRAAEACAAASPLAAEAGVRVRLLVGDGGEIARVEATSDADAGAAVARCLAGVVGEPKGGAVTRVEIALRVGKDGAVRVAPAARAAGG